MATSAIDTSQAARFDSLNGAQAVSSKADETADRFLKLLVTQLQNQDPLNPMDNAQITSQMAQINTVNGIQKLNTTVEGLNTQFVQLQTLTGAALVGNDVTVKGRQLTVQNGVAAGGFELAATADNVKVEVLNGAGLVIDTVGLGAQSVGRHSFEWRARNQAEGSTLQFRVVATRGTLPVEHTPLMRDRVLAVQTSGNSLVIETRHNGLVPYADIKGFN